MPFELLIRQLSLLSFCECSLLLQILYVLLRRCLRFSFDCHDCVSHPRSAVGRLLFLVIAESKVLSYRADTSLLLKLHGQSLFKRRSEHRFLWGFNVSLRSRFNRGDSEQYIFCCFLD